MNKCFPYFQIYSIHFKQCFCFIFITHFKTYILYNTYIKAYNTIITDYFINLNLLDLVSIYLNNIHNMYYVYIYI